MAETATAEAPAKQSLVCAKGCGKVLTSERTKKIHERACKHGETPLDKRDYSALGLLPRSRVMNAWFFKPPRLDYAGSSATALPEDCFYDTDAWSSHHIDTQVKKAYDTGFAGERNVMLVTPVDSHERLKNATPIVAFHPPEAETWEVICDLLDRAREEELGIERMRLEDLKADLQKMTQADGKSALRNTARVLEARIARLEKQYDFDALYDFFVDESRRSLAPLRSVEDVFESRVQEITLKTLSEIEG